MAAVAAFKEYPGNVIETQVGQNVLRCAAVYGANASGKTNLVLAMLAMRGLVLTSSKNSSVDKLRVDPFRLSHEWVQKSGSFEIRFLQEGFIYRYGFEITCDAVVSEWLLRSGGMRNKEFVVFTREGQAVEVGNVLPDAKDINFGELLPNVLCLSFLDNRNNPLAKKILKEFYNIRVYSGIIEETYEGQTIQDILSDPKKKEIVLKFLQLADKGIVDIGFRAMPKEILRELPQAMQNFAQGKNVGDVFVRRKVTGVDADDAFVEFSMGRDESSGTRKLFAWTAPWFRALAQGSVVFVDELETSLHPLMTKFLVGLFNSSVTNPKNAQLVFVTHDTNLLTYGNFRRDQIWLCEKRQDGASDLYALAEIAKVRKGQKLEQEYLRGRYGAIPFLGVKDLFEKIGVWE